MLKNRNVSGGYYSPLRWKRNVFEIFKHQFIVQLMKADNLYTNLHWGFCRKIPRRMSGGG